MSESSSQANERKELMLRLILREGGQACLNEANDTTCEEENDYNHHQDTLNLFRVPFFSLKGPLQRKHGKT